MDLLEIGAVFITNCGKYYKVRQLYYKVGQALLQCGVTVITKRGRYFKVGKPCHNVGQVIQSGVIIN